MRRTTLRPMLLLALLAALVYMPGLDTHGVTNWQEGQRLIVAREMQARTHSDEGWNAFLSPTVHGVPYIAKPPLLYWLTVAAAEARRGRVELWDLRLVVALAGVLGVVATYWAGWALLERRAAWWSAVFLMTGLLPTRSARIGEIDVLLIPLTALAVGAVARAWPANRSDDRARTDWAMVGLAALAATLAAMAKGPPALLVIGLAAYGGIAAWHLLAGARGPVTTQGSRWGELFQSLSRTHPVAVLGFPLLVLWLWGRAATASLSPELAAALAAAEAEDNLRLLVPDAIVKYLAAASYAVGLGSLAAIAAGVWLVTHRPQLRPGWLVVLAWAFGPILVLSLISKGVPRYLTPAWPGLALLGGLWFATLLDSLREPTGKSVARSVGAGAALLGLSLSVWYGFARDRGGAARSPRDFLWELAGPLSEHPGFPGGLYSFEFQTPALDYYADLYSPRRGGPTAIRVVPVGDTRVRESMMGGPSLAIERLAAMARIHGGSGSMIILVREKQPPGLDPTPAIDRLRDAGLTIEEIPTSAPFAIDSGRTRVKALRVSAAGPVSPSVTPPPSAAP